MLKTHRTLSLLVIAIALSLAGCFAYDRTKVEHQLGIAAIEESAFAGGDILRQEHPEEAAKIAQGIDQTVIPLLAGEKPDLTLVRTELVGLAGPKYSRYLNRAFRRLEAFIPTLPAADQEQFYAVALTGLVQSFREGLSMSTAHLAPEVRDPRRRWLMGEEPHVSDAVACVRLGQRES